MIRFYLLAAVLLSVSAGNPAQAADWKMDAGTSRLEFAATFEGNAAPGVFREFDTRLHFDADKPAEGRLDVTIAVRSADMNSTDVNKAISEVEWFDFVRFPRAEFHATEIRRTAAGRYLARGSLSLKGVQQAVEVPFAWSETGDAAKMDGEFIVKRVPFGIGTGEWASTSVIGADVTIKFSVRLRKVG
jgi:polyisoprenoid-binding protein YceI